jgi:hypothetical protein
LPTSTEIEGKELLVYGIDRETWEANLAASASAFGSEKAA